VIRFFAFDNDGVVNCQLAVFSWNSFLWSCAQKI